MNRQEIFIVGLLFVTLLVWFFYQDMRAKQHARAAPAGQMAGQKGGPDRSATGAKEAGLTNRAADSVSANATNAQAGTNAVAQPAAADAGEKPGAQIPPAEPVKAHEKAEEQVVLSNDEADIVVSSWGGGIVAVALKQYQETLEKNSGPVRFDFSRKPALSLRGVPGLATNFDFAVAQSGSTVTVQRATADKILFVRTMSLEQGYRLRIVDAFSNQGDQAVKLPPRGLAMGPMHTIQTKVKGDEGYYMEMDTQADPGDRVDTWDSSYFSSLFGVKSSWSCARPSAEGLPETQSHVLDTPLAWAAVKNKFFAQIVAVEGGSSGCELHASRGIDRPYFVLAYISADVMFVEQTIQPGEEFRQELSYYVGPKKYDVLKKLGRHQDAIMLKAYRGWSWYRELCIWVLWTLNALHRVIPNFGVAIILVTIIVRVIFWPVTHKGTQSMKKMQEIQPLISELRKKYKDKPQKLQQETMALYKKYKVNPMASCLPMLVQMPVFIALFTVLRSAVELRFAPFLWVRDLSEPEGLFGGMLPMGLSLNILPIFMTVTSVLQNKLTPSASDSQQKMMMNLMPVFLLFLFYNMASGLVLYWSISQVLAIAQLAWQKYGGHHKDEPQPQPGPFPEQPRGRRS